MDKRNRRSSILKVRQHIDITDETIAGNGMPGASTTTNRRVSFHNVKHVKQYDRDHGKLIDASPLREKITDTMDSDGILTPRGRNLDASEMAANQSIRIFGNVENGNQTADMSLETVNENEGSETLKLFDITREQTVVFEKTVKTTTLVTERVTERVMAAGSLGDDTMALFNMTDCEERDMSVDQSAVFAAPRAPRNNLTINQTVPMDFDESRVGPANDTMSLFNMSIASAKDMDISNATVNETLAKSPARSVMAKVVEENDEDVDMELTQMEAEKTLVQNQKTIGNESMNISVMPTEPFDSPKRAAVNDTMSLFRSPARVNQSDMGMETTKKVFEQEEFVAEDVNMEITNVEEPKTSEPLVLNETMDISQMRSESPKTTVVNETLALFQSPARGVNQSLQQVDSVKKVFHQEEQHHVDMEVTQTEEQEEVPMSQPMDISIAPSDSPKLAKNNDTLALFQSPARLNQSALIASLKKKELFDDSMEVEEEQGAGEGTFILPTESPASVPPEDVVIPFNQAINAEDHQSEMMLTEEASALLVREEERAMAHTSMMEVSGVQESVDINQKSLALPSDSAQETTDTSTLQEKDVSVDKVRDVSINETTSHEQESAMSPQKTMQIEADLSTLHEMTPVQNEAVSMHLEEDGKMEVEVHEKTSGEFVETETTISSHMTMSFSGSSRKPAAKSHLSRRRSLLRESVLESPRRIALENSMITMNVGEMTALSEHRRRKSLQLNQNNTTNTSVLNESANLSVARDIFALNTSVRSPHFPSAPQSTNDSTVDAHSTTESTSFQMANFDPAVTNIVWLTAENEKPVPEAQEFARLIDDEKIRMEQEIEKSLLDDTVDQGKSEAVRDGQWSKLSHDEKEAVLIARQAAEIRFLELRHSFAQTHRQKYEREAQELLQSNAQMAGKLSEIENMETLQAEIDELKNRPTEADYHRIKAEWKAAKAESFKRKLAALGQIHDTLLLMKEQKSALKMEIEEREEKLTQLQITENTEKEAMKTIVEDIMKSLKN